MLFRFQIELSDIDRGVYQSLDFRLSQHPSETATYMITRTLAYALSYQDGLEFTPGGLADPDSPALLAKGSGGGTDLWIEIGNPSARRLHKASKACGNVVVYTYKNAEALIAEINANSVHRAREIKIISFALPFLGELESHLEKNNKWSVLLQDKTLNVQIADLSFACEIKKLAAK